MKIIRKIRYYIEYFKEHKSDSKYSKEILEIFNSLKYYENHR